MATVDVSLNGGIGQLVPQRGLLTEKPGGATDVSVDKIFHPRK